MTRVVTVLVALVGFVAILLGVAWLRPVEVVQAPDGATVAVQAVPSDPPVYNAPAVMLGRTARQVAQAEDADVPPVAEAAAEGAGAEAVSLIDIDDAVAEEAAPKAGAADVPPAQSVAVQSPRDADVQVDVNAPSIVEEQPVGADASALLPAPGAGSAGKPLIEAEVVAQQVDSASNVAPVVKPHSPRAGDAVDTDETEIGAPMSSEGATEETGDSGELESVAAANAGALDGGTTEQPSITVDPGQDLATGPLAADPLVSDGNGTLDGAGLTPDGLSAVLSEPMSGRVEPPDLLNTAPVEADSASSPVAVTTRPPAQPVSPEIPEGPRFDLVRVDGAGAGVLAGRAVPGRTIRVMLDDAEVAQARAGADGKFATVFQVAPDAGSQQVTLLADGPEGAVPGPETLIIAPSPAAIADPGSVENTIAAPEATQAQPLSETPSQPSAPVATGPPQVLLADDTGLRVLQSGRVPALSAPQVSIDAIAYDIDGAVALSGRGEGRVRVYLDNKEVQTVPVAANGQWRSPLPAVDTGVYRLRVDEIDATGQVTSRAELPFQREDAKKIAALAQQDSDGPKLITVQPGYTLWGIARAEYGRGILFVHVFEANQDVIANPHWIYPGQVFSVPDQIAEDAMLAD